MIIIIDIGVDTSDLLLKTCDVKQIAFGVPDWMKYAGYVSGLPDLPEEMAEILLSQCLLW